LVSGAAAARCTHAWIPSITAGEYCVKFSIEFELKLRPPNVPTPRTALDYKVHRVNQVDVLFFFGKMHRGLHEIVKIIQKCCRIINPDPVHLTTNQSYIN